MANLFDYLSKSREKLITKSAPLNEIDILIFARLAYFPFKKIKFTEPETIKTIAQKLLAAKNARFFLADQKLTTVISKAPRYQDLQVSDYVSEFSEKIDKQFAAITVHLDDALIISYMGTDDTLIGWKEDCDMAVLDRVPAQKSAITYLKTIAKKYPEKKIYIIGHSKGGTLAMTAAVTAAFKIASRIISVYSLDGPGLSKKLIKNAKKAPVLKLIRNYVPEHSIAGRLFYHAEKYEVVKSDKEPFFYQHNLYHWQVDLKSNRIVRASLSKKSDVTDRALTEWMENASTKQKKLFVDAVFKGIELSVYDTPADVVADGANAFPKLFSAYRKLEKPERKIVFRGFKKLFKVVIREKRKIKKQAKKKLSMLKGSHE